MKKLLVALVILISVLECSAQFQVGQTLVGNDPGDSAGWDVSMPNSQTIAIGYESESGDDSWSGAVRVFQYNGLAWVQKGQDLFGEGGFEHFGGSLSMPDENTLVVGANFNSDAAYHAGQVRVFSWNGASWIQKGQDLEGDFEEDRLGVDVDMVDPDNFIAGARGSDAGGTSSGLARIYTWDGNSWIQRGSDIIGSSSYDNAGTGVAMPDLNTVAVGANGAGGTGGNGDGQVRVFKWDGTDWVQRGSDIYGENEGDDIGWVLDMPDSNTVAIGAVFNDDAFENAGQVRVFEWDGTDWVQKGEDIDGLSEASFSGSAVSMPNADMVAIGASRNDDVAFEAGKVRILKWNGTEWQQHGSEINGLYQGDYLGSAVDMPDEFNIGIGGAQFNGVAYNNAGHAKIYRLKGITGRLFNDLDQDCVYQQTEAGVISGLIGTVEPIGYNVQVNDLGLWNLDTLPPGTYTINFDTTAGWLPSCSASQSFTVIDPDTLITMPPLGFYNENPCTDPVVSIHMPLMRPCFTGQSIFVVACNSQLATGFFEDAYVLVELDPNIEVESASVSYTAMGDNTFEFFADTLNPGECFDFYISATVDCDVTLGRSLCMSAELQPIDSCSLDTLPFIPTVGVEPCETEYDRSHLVVEAWCANDSMYFSITNTADLGIGDMSCYAAVRVIVDGELMLLDSVMLNGGETEVLSFLGDGRTWRMEVDQHPDHPGESYPSVTIELCGEEANWTSDLVNILPLDDADSHRDKYCGVVTASYDPNDKTGYPLGLTDEHYISPNGYIDYRIRFQNTGTDTAFTVVLLDTLDQDLDILTVESGVSSHDYEFEIYGPRVMKWTFDNIMLPDSGVDYEGSNGFVTFTVKQQPELPDFTEINNTVAIYFDFNDPVITNTTSHIINRGILTVGMEDTDMHISTKGFKYYPNPSNGQLFVELDRSYENVQIQIFNLMGAELQQTGLGTGQWFEYQMPEQEGIYLVRLTSEGLELDSHRILKLD